MSLRRISGIPGAGVVPTTNNGVDGSGDPSKPPKKPTTFAILVNDSIWFFRTSHGRFWYALGYARRFVQKAAALIMNGVGFACSAGVELLLTSQNDFKHQWLPLVEELKLYLQTSGIADELARGLPNYRFLSNVAILAQIQNTLLQKRGATGTFPRLDRRRMASLEDNATDENISEEHRKSIIEEGKRLMSYATAAYGISTIDAAELDVHGSIQTSKVMPSSSAIVSATNLLSSVRSEVKTSKQKVQLNRSSSTSFYDEDFLLGRISEHIGIPEKDVTMMNLCDDQVEALRFFLAVDHVNKAVVMSIRGSFTVKEILIDIAAFSRPFCGGEAHSEMANAAEKIWDEAKGTIAKLLDENPGYELILTGHSLGAGAATLLNILLHENSREKVDGRTIRCFAYASPPVFAGTVAKQASDACINYIHDTDIVPFLSVDSVRRIFAALHAVEKSNLGTWIRVLIMWGSTEVITPQTLLRVESALHDPLPAKEGAPELLIPARTNVWMRCKKLDNPRDVDTNDLVEYIDAKSLVEFIEFNHSTPSDFVLVDSTKLARMGISLDPLMVTSHFANEYESALHNLR
jgi:hypothetical protein